MNNYYVDSHEKKDAFFYIWEFIDRYLLIERCMFTWIQMIAEDSDQEKGYKSKGLFQDQAVVTRDATPVTTPMLSLIW